MSKGFQELPPRIKDAISEISSIKDRDVWIHKNVAWFGGKSIVKLLESDNERGEGRVLEYCHGLDFEENKGLKFLAAIGVIIFTAVFIYYQVKIKNDSHVELVNSFKQTQQPLKFEKFYKLGDIREKRPPVEVGFLNASDFECIIESEASHGRTPSIDTTEFVLKLKIHEENIFLEVVKYKSEVYFLSWKTFEYGFKGHGLDSKSHCPDSFE
ncbi:hypothetical protein KO527_17345 [Pseudoalteromonas sp. C2R02]|uniref:hypothetical protein n=1 Tax=Pseudoalteromonas sp. C2R02 TaxID=2841565 RepID=UPI001C08C198|nr:hypothetical protein [Pseudoalteromonas sp. C2R02]MBU2971112.1 hypothetical protein [Pseudoalteromonas sp. C2R02]